MLTKGESITFPNDMLFHFKVDCTFDVNLIFLDILVHIVREPIMLTIPSTSTGVYAVHFGGGQLLKAI